MTNKTAYREFLKIKNTLYSCVNYEQLNVVKKMIETFQTRNPEWIDEIVRLKYLYEQQEKKYNI